MKQKDILLLLLPLFLIIMIWIIFSIYHNSATSTISETLDLNIKPISPDFDTQTVESLKKREQITPLFETASSSGQLEQGGNLQ